MATSPNIWDERFEGGGYEETWSEGEYVGGGATLDEDWTTVDAGSPSDWGSQCLKVVTTGNSCMVDHIFGSNISEVYIRMEFVIAAQGGSDFELMRIMNKSNTQCASFQFDTVGGDLIIRPIVSGTTHGQSGALSLNTRYRAELWINTASGWEFRLDGATIDSGPSGEVSVECGRIWLGRPTGNTNITAYIDLFGIDDSGWIGPESGTTTSTSTTSTTTTTTTTPPPCEYPYYMGKQGEPIDKSQNTTGDYTYVYAEACPCAGYISKIEVYTTTGTYTWQFSVFSRSVNNFTDEHYKQDFTVSDGLNVFVEGVDYSEGAFPIDVGEYFGWYSPSSETIERDDGAETDGYLYQSGDQIGDDGPSGFTTSQEGSGRQVQIRITVRTDETTTSTTAAPGNIVIFRRRIECG